MPRMKRLKYSDPLEGHYHIISRTVLKSFLLGTNEKEFFVWLLKKLSRVYFVKINTFSIMSNHFHLIVQMIPDGEISDLEIKQRFEIYYNEGVSRKRHRLFNPSDIERYRHRWGDISNFVQDLKQRFSRWYNQKKGGHGHIWSERFKSVMLENNNALLACMVYVELNSVRAGIVKRPEDYRYCGLAHLIAGGRISKWLDKKSLYSLIFSESKSKISVKKVLQEYLEVIYQTGTIEREGKAHISEKEANRVIHEKFEDLNLLSFRRRIDFFSDGIVLGSQSFCEAKFNEFRGYFKLKKERKGKPILSNRSSKKKKKAEGLLDFYTIKLSLGS